MSDSSAKSKPQDDPAELLKLVMDTLEENIKTKKRTKNAINKVKDEANKKAK